VFEIMKASGTLAALSRYAGVNLHEPPKTEVLRWKPGEPIKREASSGSSRRWASAGLPGNCRLRQQFARLLWDRGETMPLSAAVHLLGGRGSANHGGHPGSRDVL